MFVPCQTHWNLGKSQEKTQLTKETPCLKLTKEFQNAKDQGPKRTHKAKIRANSTKEFSLSIRGGYRSSSSKIRALRQIAPESLPERSAKSLSHSFFVVPFLSPKGTEGQGSFWGHFVIFACFSKDFGGLTLPGKENRKRKKARKSMV